MGRFSMALGAVKPCSYLDPVVGSACSACTAVQNQWTLFPFLCFMSLNRIRTR